MALILSKSAFAARRGVGASTVSNWLSRGRLTPAALTADGRIRVDEAERQLGATLDFSRSLGQSAAHADAVAAPMESPAGTAVGEMAAIKLEKARRQLQRDRESDLERRGLYVLTAEIRRVHARELAQFIAAAERRLPELIDLLAGHDGKGAVVLARHWWRSLRQAEAEAAGERAAASPEFTLQTRDV